MVLDHNKNANMDSINTCIFPWGHTCHIYATFDYFIHIMSCDVTYQRMQIWCYSCYLLLYVKFSFSVAFYSKFTYEFSFFCKILDMPPRIPIYVPFLLLLVFKFIWIHIYFVFGSFKVCSRDVDYNLYKILLYRHVMHTLKKVLFSICMVDIVHGVIVSFRFCDCYNIGTRWELRYKISK